MVRRAPKKYLVKVGRECVFIDKDVLKEKNLALALEYKTADAARRGKILTEYFDLNRKFVNYFPQYHGDYREEIINTFFLSIPDYFMRFDPTKGMDLNSFLAKFAKKNALVTHGHKHLQRKEINLTFFFCLSTEACGQI